MNRLIRASAGSGKTHALTTQYLRLLRERHRAAPSTTVEDEDTLGVATILAATFTRKAAGEIFDRLLTRLASAALTENGLTALQNALDEQCLTAGDCRDLLRRLCRSLHHVQIGTLDSFFGRLCRVYGPEMGLGGDVRLTHPQDPRCRALQAEALDATLDSLGGLDAATTLFQTLTRQEAPSSVGPRILELLQAVSEAVTGAEPEHWETLSVPDRPAQTEIDAALSHLEEYRLTLAGKQWPAAVESDLRRFRDGAWEEFLGGGLAKPCLAGTCQYYNKPIPTDAVAAYAVLLDTAKHALLAELRDRTLALRTLHREFSAQSAALRLPEGIVFFAETPLLLKAVLGDGTDGARQDGVSLEHILLDEFQDTSDPQWGLLRGFALGQAVRSSGSVFVVGDAKQAIYGWRGGRAEIFQQLEHEICPVTRETLEQSHRSSSVVLGVVNDVFRAIPGNEALAEHPETAARWAEHFQEHHAAKALPGRVEFCVSPVPPDSVDGEEAGEAPDHLACCAERMAGEIGRLPPGTSVGVLVRTNAALARMTDLLRAFGIPAGGEGVGRIADDPAVELLLSALTLADHPGHTAAAHHVARSPLGAVLGLADHADAARTAAVAAAIRCQLLDEGYGAVLCRWAALLSPFGLERTARRLEQVVEMAAEFDTLPPMHPDDFARAVREREAEMPGRAQVRVMTINRAKGLEFDVVFLPDLDWKIQPSDKPCLVQRADPREIAAGASAIRAVHAWPSRAHQALHPALADGGVRAQAEEVTGMLCLLYVAMTRARHALHLYVAPHALRRDGTPEKPGLKPASLLRAALCGGAAHRDQGQDWRTLWRAGEPDWWAQWPPPHAPSRPDAPPRPALRFRPSDGPRPGSLPPGSGKAPDDAPRTAADLLTLYPSASGEDSVGRGAQ